MPLISFVIPTFNRALFLEIVLKDLIAERRLYYPNMEIIVVDGGSKDGTAEMLKNYESELSCWVSEPDKGPGDAFKKGIQKAKGDFIRYMSDDDRIIPGCTRKMMEIMLSRPDFDIVGGGVKSVYLSKSGELIPCLDFTPAGDVALSKAAAPDLNGFIVPEACLFRKKLFSEIGYWKPNMMACDAEFFLRTLKKGRKIFMADEVYLHKYWHDDSTVLKRLGRMRTSIFEAIAQNAGVIPASAYYYRVVIGPWLEPKRKWMKEHIYRPLLILAAKPFHKLGLHPVRFLERIKKKRS